VCPFNPAKVVMFAFFCLNESFRSLLAPSPFLPFVSCFMFHHMSHPWRLAAWGFFFFFSYSAGGPRTRPLSPGDGSTACFSPQLPFLIPVTLPFSSWSVPGRSVTPPSPPAADISAQPFPGRSALSRAVFVVSCPPDFVA